METLVDHLRVCLKAIADLFEKFVANESLERNELVELREALESCVAALEYEEACIDEACQSAMSHAADKNRAEKVNWQDLDLSNVKPGQDQRKRGDHENST